jgi:ubiquitin-conjugating enzyme E2 S
LQTSLPPNYLFPEPDSNGAGSLAADDLTQLLILITGAEGTPYSQGLWRLHLKIPQDYPKNPPKATFKTRIYHPNVEESTGAVCLETLKRDWDPKLTLKDILVTISCLLIQPNPDSALNAAAGALIQEDYEAFSTQAKLMTSIHARIPTHLRKAVQEAKRRGEDHAEDESIQPQREAQTPLEAAKEDDTKENTSKPSSSRQKQPTDWRANTNGKRPLSELPSPVDVESENASDVKSADTAREVQRPLGEPVRKSPKLVRSSASSQAEDNNAHIQVDGQDELDGMPPPRVEEEKESSSRTTTSVLEKQAALRHASFMSRPTALRKVSNVGRSRQGQPRVGIHRL